jgi:hypothetical protein
MIAEKLTWVTGSSLWKMKLCAPPRRLVLFYLVLMLSVHFCWCTVTSSAAELKVRSIESSPIVAPASEKPDQLPLSRVVRGNRDIAVAWLAGPTDRYRHGVLGDDLEATRLVVETRSGKRLQVDLPLRRVFEDLEPRLADVDGNGRTKS